MIGARPAFEALGDNIVEHGEKEGLWRWGFISSALAQHVWVLGYSFGC
jgi:hypothetical protein